VEDGPHADRCVLRGHRRRPHGSRAARVRAGRRVPRGARAAAAAPRVASQPAAARGRGGGRRVGRTGGTDGAGARRRDEHRGTGRPGDPVPAAVRVRGRCHRAGRRPRADTAGVRPRPAHRRVAGGGPRRPAGRGPPASTARGPRRVRRARPGHAIGTVRASARTVAHAPGATGARVGAVDGRPAHGERSVRGCPRANLGQATPGRVERPRPRTGPRAPTHLARALRAGSRDARGAVPGPRARRAGYRAAVRRDGDGGWCRPGDRGLRCGPRALRATGGRPPARRSDPLRGTRGARRDPGGHRRRGRVGDARRGRYPQPPAHHPHQAVRCHGRGGAGRRQRPAGDGAHRALHRLRRAVRPQRPSADIAAGARADHRGHARATGCLPRAALAPARDSRVEHRHGLLDLYADHAAAGSPQTDRWPCPTAGP